MTNEERLQELFALLDEMEAYYRVIGKVSFDMECCAPPEGMERAGEDMAILGKQVYAMTHAPRYIELLEALGIDIYIRLPFTEQVAHMSAESFIKNILSP